MFRRFRGIEDRKLDLYMRFFIMQKYTLRRSSSALVIALGAAALMCAVASAAHAAAMPKETGLWIDDSGDGAVKIEPCGTKLCGHIAWLRKLVNDKGDVLKDRHNPDPKMQSRLICGLPVIGELNAQPEGGFDGGWVYDPKEGKSYSVAIQTSGTDQLQVTGYLGVKLLGKTLIWTRAKTDLPSCTSNAAAAPPNSKQDNPVGSASTAAKLKNGNNGEALPWADAKPSSTKPSTAKASETSSKLGAGNANPAAQNLKKSKPSASTIPQPPETASQ